MFLILGITGKVGGAAAHALIENGHAVRAMVRDPQKAAAWSARGVDVRHGDFTDAAALRDALEGVDGAFVMVPPVMAPAPGFPEASEIIASFRAALLQAPPPRLVALSSIGSDRDHGIGLITTTHLLEQALDDLPTPLALVRAGGFLDNFAYVLDRAATTGWLDTFLQPTDRPFLMVAAADIGKEVARLLVGGWQGRKIVELGSAVSVDDVAGAMAEVLGRSVQARSIPRDKWAATLESYGLPAGRTAAYEEMEDAFNSGWIDTGAPGSEPVAGMATPARTFALARQSSG